MKVIEFFRGVYQDNDLRKDIRRRLARDLSLYARNLALRPLEEHLVRRYYRPDHPPIVFIVGAPRSGTTLLYQVMAKYMAVGYIPNFAAPYWMAPVFGSLLFRRFVRGRDLEIPLESHLGATSGAASPHELSWFWHYWAGQWEVDCLTAEQLARIDWVQIRRELGALAASWRAPLVMKSINFTDYNIAHVHAALGNVRFIDIQRDPRFVVQSILESRKKRYGDDKVWWSVKPKDFERLKATEPLEQVCYQVADIRRAIDSALGRLPESAHRIVPYEQLVASPSAVIQELALFLGVAVRKPDELAALRLKNGNKQRMSASDFERIHTRLEPPA